VERDLFDDEHDLFRDSVRSFLEKEIVPHHPAWEEAGIVDRDMFRKAGAQGFLGMAAPRSSAAAGWTTSGTTSSSPRRSSGPA
jgi:alkylation response protein AidB-like acyl-CoA dehydrogenase